MTVKPAPTSQRAYDGGVWNAWQSVLPGPHFELPPVESVPSRLPRTTSPARSASTSEKNDRPPSGGRFGVEPITMSPVAAMVTTPGGIFGFAAGVRTGLGFGGLAAPTATLAPCVATMAGGSVPSMTREKRKPAATATAPARTISAMTRIAEG